MDYQSAHRLQPLPPTLRPPQAIFYAFAVRGTSIDTVNTTTVKANHNKSKMVARKKAAGATASRGAKASRGGKGSRGGKASGGRIWSKSKSAPKKTSLPRVICPGCSNELALDETLARSQNFVCASKTDMKKFDIECKNESCVLYIEGLGDVDDKLPVNPVVKKCVDYANKKRATIKAIKENVKAERKKKKREDKKAEYARYNPLSGAKEKEASDSQKRHKRMLRHARKMAKGWKKIEKTTKKIEALEKAAGLVAE